jgi:NarL family two-component system response regulator LiaR
MNSSTEAPHPVIRVVIVDDHEAIRRSLAIFMRTMSGVVVVGEAMNGKEAISLVQQTKPDVVLMDLMMPVMDGITATKILHEQFPALRIIILTSAKERSMHKQVLEAGAERFILKDTTLEELTAAILS